MVFETFAGHRLATVLAMGVWPVDQGDLRQQAHRGRPPSIRAFCVRGHLWTTGQELVLDSLIRVAGGVIGGYALGRSPRLAGICGPYVMAFYGVPKIALAPLFIIWFGIGMGSKIALASIMVFFLVFYNVFAGVRSVDRELVNLTLVMGANQRQLTYHVFLPAAAPFVMLGMRLAIPYSVIGVIVGERARLVHSRVVLDI